MASTVSVAGIHGERIIVTRHKDDEVRVCSRK